MSITRREFVASASAAALAGGLAPALASSFAARSAHAFGDDSIKVGVIGCGGRGTGAAVNALEADPATRIVALGDLFPDRLKGCREALAGHEFFASRATVPADRCFAGFDAFRRVVATDVDVVILATPPGFRPTHFEAAVAAGKHVFMEKPVAVDPAGVRKVLEAAKAADAKGLSVAAGTQRRHEACYLAAMDRIRNGDIGQVVGASVYWNQGGLWDHARKPEYTDMEWHCRNWLYFAWLSGDHIVEQHVHNLDVANWALGSTPARCIGMGGRQVRTDARFGHIFDHFTVQYEHASGAVVTSMCRQIDGCASRVEEIIRGTKGVARLTSGSARIEGERPWTYAGESPNPYVQEHADLLASLRGSGTRLNEARTVAESTLTAIMGRMSAYTGQELTWETALASKLDLLPAAMEFGSMPPLAVPTPGRTILE